MTSSSFYADGETYDTAEVESNDVPGSTETTTAPSGFYPDGTDYAQLADEGRLRAEMTALKDAAATSASNAFTSEANAAASASAAAASASNAASDVQAAAGTALPLMDGVATVGAGTKWSREDHKHPTDTSRQAADSKLSAIAGVTAAADKLFYFTGTATGTLADFSAFGRTLVDDANAAAARVTLGLGGAATLNVGSSAGTVAAGDDSRITGSAQKASNLSDLSSASTSRDNLFVFGVIRIQKFTASGTYTPHAKMQYCIVEAVGGGGSAGGVAGTSPTNVTSSGGASGSFSMGLHTPADIGASKTVTIGAGGAAPTAGANAGNAGGTTSLGTLVVAPGGGGGPGGSTGTVGATVGIPGGVGTGNILAIDGMAGGGGSFAPSGSVPGVFGGFGGASRLSGSARVRYRAAGLAGLSYGGGGAGAMTDQTANLAGGAGADGVVIITEFCTS